MNKPRGGFGLSDIKLAAGGAIGVLALVGSSIVHNADRTAKRDWVKENRAAVDRIYGLSIEELKAALEEEENENARRIMIITLEAKIQAEFAR